MEKRLFLAFFVTLVFFVVYSHLVAKFVPQQSAIQEDSEKFSESAKAKSLSLTPPATGSLLTPADSEAALDLPQVSIGNFSIKYSTVGGYIKNISIIDEEYPLPFHNIGFLPEDDQKKFNVTLHGQSILFTGPRGEQKEFVFNGNLIDIRLNPPPQSPWILFSNYLETNALDQRYQEIFYSQKQQLRRISPKKVRNNAYNDIDFAGARDRYYCLSLLEGAYNIKWVNQEQKIAHLYLSSSQEQTLFYLGPQVKKELKPFGLQEIVYYGFFNAIALLMVKVLYLFYGLLKSWGWSIVLFSASVSLVLFPFTSKSSKAMRKMQQIQPEVEALKTKHKDNPQKLQKETIELYRKYKINPLGGCLPLFLQIPVIMAFYQVVYRFVELKGAEFLWIKDLSSPDHLPLPFPAPFNHVNIIPVFLIILGILQQKMTTSSSVASSQQKSMGLFFAVFIGVIFYGFPAALTIYWLIQNVFSLSYQARLSQVQA